MGSYSNPSRNRSQVVLNAAPPISGGGNGECVFTMSGIKKRCTTLSTITAAGENLGTRSIVPDLKTPYPFKIRHRDNRGLFKAYVHRDAFEQHRSSKRPDTINGRGHLEVPITYFRPRELHISVLLLLSQEVSTCPSRLHYREPARPG